MNDATNTASAALICYDPKDVTVLVTQAAKQVPPGGHVAAFCRLTDMGEVGLALRLADLEIRDTIRVVHHALSADYLIVLARRRLSERGVGRNTLAHGVGGINIDACRVRVANRPTVADLGESDGRFPANILFVHRPLCSLQKCEADCALSRLDDQSGYTVSRNRGKVRGHNTVRKVKGGLAVKTTGSEYDDAGGASRFFPAIYASAGQVEVEVMKWVMRLLTPADKQFKVYKVVDGCARSMSVAHR